MTPMEAWRVISANVTELYKRRKTSCYNGFTDADIEAEVVCFNALRQAQNSKDVTDTNVGNKSEWISVEERLPDPTKNVLVCKTFRGKPYIDIGCVKDAETCCCASDEFIIKPWLHKLTHWMPLPEPPKGE